MERIQLRPLAKRVLYVLGAVFVVSFLLSRFHIPSNPAFGHQRWTGTSSGSGPLRDIRNSTLGFEKIFVVGLPYRTDRRDGMALQAALSDIKIEFIDGVKGKDVSDKAIPSAKGQQRLSDGAIGCWRAHIAAAHEIVQRNLSSALILEDDSDWDVRIKDQLQDFARATNALTQPLQGRAGVHYADPTYPMPSDNPPETMLEIPFHQLPATVAPTRSPYGDNWDVLWVGHCGMHFPFAHHPAVPKARVIRHNDITVAPKRNLWTFNIPFTLKDSYPEHTRAYHHAQEGVCALGYALSQRGARKLLHEVALKPVTDAVDILLRFFCEGEKGRAKGRQCLTTQPALFHHHRMAGPASAMSDIGNHGDGYREEGMTDMVRWSVRLNADVLLEGGGEEGMVDQYPDE